MFKKGMSQFKKRTQRTWVWDKSSGQAYRVYSWAVEDDSEYYIPLSPNTVKSLEKDIEGTTTVNTSYA